MKNIVLEEFILRETHFYVMNVVQALVKHCLKNLQALLL